MLIFDALLHERRMHAKRNSHNPRCPPHLALHRFYLGEQLVLLPSLRVGYSRQRLHVGQPPPEGIA